jgi:pimeloyl-ACP methyl ester carboxylesterase
MDYESERIRKLGCWDPRETLTKLIEYCTSKEPNNDFSPTADLCDYIIDVGFGKDAPSSTRKQWHELIKKNYSGDAGRKRMREAAVNLRDRDGLHGRLVNVKCPVLWVHGDQDVAYSVENAREEIKLFEGSPDAKLIVIQGGHNFLSWTHPQEVDALVAEFVMKNSKGLSMDARALREAVGMVEI